MVPSIVTPKLPKPEVKVEEKIIKAEVVDEHIEKIQDLQSYKQHDDKVSTLLFETTNEVGFRVDVKRKSTEDKVRCEKVFDVDKALDIENSRASSFQVKGIHVDETKSMRFGIGLHLRYFMRFHDHLEIATLHDILVHAIETYVDNKYLGTRFGTDGIVREYKWITYREACIAWLEVGSGLLYHGIPKGSTGLHFNSRPEWVIVDNACFTYSYISILLYDAISLDAATFILNLATVQVIFCVPNTLKDLLSYLLEIPYVCLIMVVGTRYDELTSLQSQKMSRS
ncbi:long chain acyl-CoA synthetase 6, peroxisomal-like protein [Tanacetum coccineum]